MCGIWAFLQAKEPNWNFSRRIGPAVDTLKARGPDSFGMKTFKSEDEVFVVQTAFARLAINDPSPAGNQPFEDGTLSWMCNGEIYNHKKIESSWNFKVSSESDCEVLGSVWNCNKNNASFEQKVDFFHNNVRGVYAFIHIDIEKKELVAIRDPYGVRPLYYMVGQNGVFLGSERKSLEPLCEDDDVIQEFPPGVAMMWKLGETQNSLYETSYRFHILEISSSSDFENENTVTKDLYEVLNESVQLRMLSDRPIAALLSGGLDSTSIAALVHLQLLKEGKSPLKTFSIGLEGSSDLEHARFAADWYGFDHTEIVVTADEMFDCIPDVIKAIESYDVTTVRASVGNWMVARYIAQNTDCKVVFNGDGSDEVFGSYLYFFKAPSDKEYEEEVNHLLNTIHKYDVLRSDRSISSHGLEARTPFLDKKFVDFVRTKHPQLRRPLIGQQMEKILLRKAAKLYFSMPDRIGLRRKEAFSDGVSGGEKSWYQIIQEKIKEKKLVPENWREVLSTMPDWAHPQTEEAFYYYYLFLDNYKHVGDPWPYWMPKWCPETSDPSARTLALY